MLGRGVGHAVRWDPRRSLFADEVVAAAREADALLLNLECCVSRRGARQEAPGKAFFFRAPPEALAHLRALGTSCATVANNHVLDFGPEALLDTLGHLADAGIVAVGAGRDEREARAPRVLQVGALRIGVVAFADHPAGWAAGPGRPGIAYADLSHDAPPPWVTAAIAAARAESDLVLVSPHWGPNNARAPVPEVRAAGGALLTAGAAVVAGHSAHVFQGIEGPVFWDLGGLVDDYASHPALRSDLGVMWIVTLDERGPHTAEAVPLRIEGCATRLARGGDRDWIRGRLTEACAAMGTGVEEAGDRLLVRMREP